MSPSPAIKENVQQQWQKRVRRARKKLVRLEDWIAGERYELEIAKRLLQKATDEETRDAWQIHAEVLESAVMQTEWRIREEHSEIVLCEAMLAEICADIETDDMAKQGEPEHEPIL